MPDHDDGSGDGDGPGDGDGSGHNRPSGPMLLVAAAVVIAVGLFLSTKIRDMNRMQDCVLAGHTNCAPIDSSER